MAISANAVWECRSTATAGNANGGFFVTGASGSDFSQQNAAQYNLTGCSAGGGSATLAHASAAADMVGNGLKVVSGTNATVGWYEIISVNVGVDITVDRNCTTGATVNTVVNIGGALSLGGSGGSSDDVAFETCVAGNKIWIKSGTYTAAASVALGTGVGTTTARIVFEGYNSTRGDLAGVETNRPVLALGIYAWAVGAYTDIYNMSITATSTSAPIQGTTGCRLINCKVVLSTTNANVGASTSFAVYRKCELVSLRGRAITSNGSSIIGCYLHDSDTGYFQNGNGGVQIIDTIISNNVTAGVNLSGSGLHQIKNTTLYGSAAKIGTGITASTGVLLNRIFNSIISGFTTGLNHADAGIVVNYSDYNNFYNNTTDVTNWAKGTYDIALNPAFANVSEITGTNGTTSGAVLTSSGANFSSVVDGADYCHIISGTGVTVGKYIIQSHTTDTLTLSPSPGTDATADKVFSISCGHDFRVGTNMANAGYPGTFGGGLTQGYIDIGAVQRKQATVVYAQ